MDNSRDYGELSNSRIAGKTNFVPFSTLSVWTCPLHNRNGYSYTNPNKTIVVPQNIKYYLYCYIQLSKVAVPTSLTRGYQCGMVPYGGTIPYLALSESDL